MTEQEKIQQFKHRLRIFFILYTFSENYSDDKNPTFKKLFESEIKLQKLDFWVRNPDHLCYSLLELAETDMPKSIEIKSIVKKIFNDNEPVLRRDEMEKFRFGAYEDLSNVISFLDGMNLIRFDSKRTSDLRVVDKKYFVTENGVNIIESQLPNLNFLHWYMERCQLIKKYFGDKSGTELKDLQYKIEEYKNARSGNFITEIIDLVKLKFNQLYHESL